MGNPPTTAQAETIKRGRHEAVPLPGLPRSEDEIAADPQPGDIYRTSWGYDQTNVEFFEVVARTPGTVTVRRIAARLGSEELGENPGRVYPAPGVYARDWSIDGNETRWNDKTGEREPNPVWAKAERDGFSEKRCRLDTKRRKWQSESDPIIPGRGLTIDNVRTAWPYSTGGAYDTIAAGHPGH